MAILDVNSGLHEFLRIQTCRAQLYTRFHEGFKTFLRIKHERQFNALMAELTAAFKECSMKVIAIEGGLRDMGRADLAATLRSVQEAERDKLRLTLTHQALKQAAAFRTFSWQQQQQGGSGGDGDVGDDDEALALLDPHFAATARGGCTHNHGHSHGHGHGHEEAPAPSAAQDVANVLAASGSDAAAGPCSMSSCTALAASGGPAAVGRCGAAAAVPPAAVPGADDADGAGGLSGGSSVGSGAGVRDGGGGAGGSCGVEGAGGDGRANGGGTAAVSAVAPEPTRREFEAAVKEALQGIDACIRSINEAIGDVRMELEDG